MLNNACIPTTESRSLDHSYANVAQALEALTAADYSWLRRLAARRLTRLRTHLGLARYLAGVQPDDLINETIVRLQQGSRQTKPVHLIHRQSFLNHFQGIMNSIASNYTRHAEPHINHVALDAGDGENLAIDPPALDDVARQVEETDLLNATLAVLAHTASLEERAGFTALESVRDLPAHQLAKELPRAIRHQVVEKIAPELEL